MSRDALGFLFDALAAAVIMFIAPVIWQAYEYDLIMQRNVEKAVAEFAETVSDKGYIDMKVYQAFMKKLDAAGGVCRVEIMHSQTVYEPEYENGAFTGEVMTYTDETYTSVILERLRADGAYLMEIGDLVCVRVDPERCPAGRAFLRMILGRDEMPSVSASRMISGCEDMTYRTYLR